MANSVDPDETPRSAASHLGLNCFLRPVCPNTYGKYGSSQLTFLTVMVSFSSIFARLAEGSSPFPDVHAEVEGSSRRTFVLGTSLK